MGRIGSTGQGLSLPALVGSGVTLVVALLTRASTGSPLVAVHKLNALEVLPPLWLLGVLWLCAYALLGGATGYLLGRPVGGGRNEALLWRGAAFLVLTVALSLVWYTLLFGKLCVFPAWLCLPLSATAALICTLSWWRLCRGAALITAGFALWQVAVFLMQLCVMLCL